MSSSRCIAGTASSPATGRRERDQDLGDDYYHPAPDATDEAIQKLRQKFGCE